MATAAEEEGTFCARANFKASIEETIAVLQHCSIDSGGPGGSEHAIGASSTAVSTAKTASDGGEERPRSMSDIIAEAMRENGVPQQRQSDIIRNDNDRPRKSTSTAAAAAVVAALTSPSSLPPPSRLASAVAMRMASPEAAYGETEDPQALRDALSAASAAAHASPASAGKPSPAADGIVLNDSDQAASTVIPKASPCCETGVARAMAEAILDEGYMAPSISKHLGAGSPTAAATAPAGASVATAAAESDSLNTKVPAGVAMRPVGREPNVEASRNFHEASSTTAPDAPGCSRDTPRSKILETKLGGTTPPVTNRGGIDAPFGHAVIIEEHVRAELKTSSRNQVGRRLGLHVGLNKTHTPAGVNLRRKSGGEAKAPTVGSAGAGYSSGTTGGSCDDAQGTLKAGQAAATAGAPPSAAAAAKTVAGERGHVAGGGDGFLGLQGGRSSLNTLASLAAKAGMVARANMPSRGGSGAPGRDPSKRSSPDSSTPEEYVLLQQEREAGEAVLSMRGDSASIKGERVVSVAVARNGGQMSQAAAEPGPIRGGDRVFHLRGSLLVGQSSVAAPSAVEEDEEKGGDARDLETGSPDPAFVDAANSVHTGGGDKFGDGDGSSSRDGGGAWSASPGRHGIGQSGAGGSWDHVDGNGCLEDVDGDKEERKVNDDEDPAVLLSDTQRVSVDVESPLNELREAGENQGLVAPGRGPEPRAGKLHQSELLVVGDIDETEAPDHVQGMRGFGVNGAPARCSLGTKADVGDNLREKDGGADSGLTAGKKNGDAPPCGTSPSAVPGPDARADNGPDGISDGNEGESREVEDSGQMEQAWKKPAEKGVANEGALGYHDVVGLPKPPLAETVPPGNPESAGAVDSATGAAFVGEGGPREGVAGDGRGGASAGVSFGDVGRISDKRGYESSGEEDQPVFSAVEVAPQQQVVGGLPLSCSARNTGSGTLVTSMAEAVGARAAAPEELLGHFVCAGGGDVDKAAALYLDVADEFVELREIARNRQNASTPYAGGVLAHSTTPVDVAASIPAANPAGFGEPDPSSMVDGATTEDKGVSGTKPRGASCAMVESSDAAMASSCSYFPQRRVGKEMAAAAAVAESWRPPQQALDADFPSFEADPKDIDEGRDEYSVTISSQKLGMTVENVLERTVVRAAAPGGGAEAAGVETGSLLVALDGQSTKDSSHFEVIELLRVAKRPLTLRLRRVARERLVSRRAEMRALTRSHGVIATGGAVGSALTADQVTAAIAGSSLTENRDSCPGISASLPPPSPTLRELSRQDSAPLGHPRQVSDTHDAEAARIPRVDGGKGGTRAAMVGVSTGAVTAAAAAAALVGLAPGGLRGSETCSVVVSRATREQAAPASVAGFSTGNWEAVEWAESRLLKILRLLCVGEEVRASEEEEAAAAAAAQAAAEARAQAEEEAARDNAVAVSTARKLDKGKNVEERTAPVASSGGRHPSPIVGIVAGAEEAWRNGQSVPSRGAAVPISTGANVESICGKEEDWEGLGVWRATEAEEAEASRAHSELIRREETHKAIIQLLLEFSDMLERDWRQARRQDHSQGGKNADGNGNPIGGAGSGAGGGSGVGAAAAAACTARGRIESMGALVEQLGPLIDWESEAVAAVEPELRELLFVLLDADLNFDLSSAKFPRLVGGGVAAMMQELLMHLPTEQAVLEAPPLAHRLALSNSVCARGACCAMVATTYSLPSLPGQLQFRGILSRLLHDRINGVRGEAVKALAYVAPVADPSTCRWLMLLVERASRDEDLSVRRASVDTLLQIGRRLLGVLDDHGGVRGPEGVDGYAIGGMSSRGNGHTNGHTDGHSVQDAVEGEEDEVAKGRVADADADVEVEAAACDLRREIHALRSKLLPTLSRLAADTEWQVRVEIAYRLDILCVALGEDCSAVTTEILPSLVKDTDPDVRSEAVRCLPRVARILLGFAMSGYAATVATVATGTDSSSAAEADPRPAAHQEADEPAPALASAMSPSDTCSSGCDGGGAPSSECWLDTSTDPSSLLPSSEGEGAAEADGACAEAGAGREDGKRGRDAAPVPSASSPVRAFHQQEPFRKSIRERVEESNQEPVRDAVSQKPSSVLPCKPDIEFEEQSQAGPVPAELSCSGSGGSQGFPVDDFDIGDGDDGDGDRSLGGIGAAAQRARKDILGALMPAVAMLIEDSTAEVRATAAVSLGEVLRLMVGFEDCVAALGSSGSGGGQGVGDRASGDVRNTLNGRGRRSPTASMETCCCVTGEDSEGLIESSGAGRRVCHGKLLREAEAAAVSAADAMAEAAMTAELMDLAGFEPNRDEDEDADLSGNSDAISGEGVGVGDASEGFPVDMEEDVDAHVSALLQVDDPSALVEEETLIGPRGSTENSECFSHPSEGDARAVAVMGARKAGPPGHTAADRHETNSDEMGGATSACALAVEKLRSTTRHGEPKCPDVISTASPGGSGRDDEGYETSQEDNWNPPVDGGKGGRDIDTVCGGDDRATGVVDPDVDGDDPLIALVRRLLLDPDANVACTMLQALRPAWGAELGPGPGPERRPLRAAVGDDCGEEWQPPGETEGNGSVASNGGLREGRGYPNGRDGALSPVRSCMLTPAQVGCVLPALAELFRNPLWRLRAAVAEALPALVSCTLCDRLKDEVINLGRRMLFDRVDAVRRSAAEQLVMAARIDLDRCPARHLHHVPGACTRETHLPSLRPRQPSPEPNPTSAAHLMTEPVQQGRVDAADAGPGQGEEDLASEPNATTPPQGVKEGDESTFEYRVDARTCVRANPQTEDDPPTAPEGGGGGELGEGAEACPRDRGGACGMWLRLVMAPLMRECLEASYRGKLLALHMTQAAFRVGVTTPAVMTSVVVPSLLRGLSDPVPNVRLTAARVADDVLAVAAMSSWPAPDGRSRATALTHDDDDGDDGCGDRSAEKRDAATAAFPWAFTPAENDGGTDVGATAVFEAASAPLGSGSRADGAEGLSSAGRGLRHDREPGHGRGNGVKGAWWNCGWQEVEFQLEALSGGDPDRDVAYFAAQALKPKWEGDVWRP